MSDDDRRITSGHEFEAIMFPKRARERASAAQREAEVRARELGESLAHEHLRALTTGMPERRQPAE